jgi:hypothetical protein
LIFFYSGQKKENFRDSLSSRWFQQGGKAAYSAAARGGNIVFVPNSSGEAQ